MSPPFPAAPSPSTPPAQRADRALAAWTGIPANLRRKMVAAAAATLCRCDLSCADITGIDPARGAWVRSDARLAFQLDNPPPESPEPIHLDRLLETFAEWRRRFQPVLSEMELAVFIGAFARKATVPRPQARAIMAQILHLDRRAGALHAVARHKTHLASLETANGFWKGAPAPDLAATFARLAESPGTRVLKRSRASCVTLADFDGESVILKRFDTRTDFWRRLRDELRGSKARRAVAAARALAEAGIRTPDLLGFASGGGAEWTATRRLDGWITLREWAKPALHLRPASVRHAAADLLLAALARLFAAGFWHADLKPSNLLVPARGPSSPDEFAWIDLEDIVPGVRLTRSRLLRNLAQLNGGIGRRLPREDRMRFLQRLGAHFPGLAGPEAARWVEAETRRRLEREKRRECRY